MKNAILLHLHYQHLWPEFWSYLKNIKDENTDLYVTVNTTETEWFADIKTNATETFMIENRGQDFGGFLYAYNKIKHIDYNTITKIHGKMTTYMSPTWRQNLYLPIIGSKERYSFICELFNNTDIFVAGAKKHFWDYTPFRIDWVDELLDTKHIVRKIHVSGSMYVFSKKYLDLLFKDKELELYEKSRLGYDKNKKYMPHIGHHLECLICNCESYGGKLLGLDSHDIKYKLDKIY